ncbi:hypothetical protein N7478_011439 [Penicillium angulare]|uniref:uncharacterized protein n=1 Tax=Penicillium angulare TaxID=116970 RepID=UPI00254205AE|nr:uncharacterized protein N7478_011439 [Penicillium angulare]KAJ5263834.1 hypothetical protein N7478_011439 [Penicillium angulare]
MAAVDPPMVALFKNAVFLDRFVEMCIDDGGHDALHSLVKLAKGEAGLYILLLLKKGTPNGWTAAHTNRAKMKYATYHLDDHKACRDLMPQPTAYFPPAPSAAITWIIRNCSDCFKFLVRQEVIKPTGYNHMFHSYFCHACSSPASVPLAKWILGRIPNEELFAPQALGPTMAPLSWPQSAIFWRTRNHEDLFAQYINRLEALSRLEFNTATIPVIRGGGNMGLVMGGAHIHALVARYITPKIANDFGNHLAPMWSFNVNELGVVDDNGDNQSLWIALINERNPRRIHLMRWMAANPFPVFAAMPSGTFVNEPLYWPANSKGWIWEVTPLGAAVASGDTAVVQELCRMPIVNILSNCGCAHPGTRTFSGTAGLLNELREESLSAFELWLRYAAPLIRAQGLIFPEVVRMFHHLMIQTALNRDKCATRMDAAPTRAAKRIISRERDAIEATCIRAIRIIYDAFRTIQGPTDTRMSRQVSNSTQTLSLVELYEDPLFKSWASSAIVNGRSREPMWNMPNVFAALLPTTSRYTLRRPSTSADVHMDTS